MPEIYDSAQPPKTKQEIESQAPQLKEVEKIKKEKSASPLSAFVPSPKNWRFETQEREERIILVLRKHWLTNLGWILTSLILAFCPQFLLAFFSFEAIPLRFKAMGILIWYLLLAGFIIERFLNWFFNVFIITDERIVDFDFYGLIYKEISDAKTEDIQDVTYRVGGFFRNLLNFGDVFIQTAAQIPQFEFSDVPQPGRVAKILRELITEEEIEKLEGRVR
jgi:uncharacterized membrane protein YdbT with pleckstrin-like domain